MGSDNDVVEFNNVAHGHKIAALADTYYNPLCDIVISRAVKGKLLGGCLYQNYTGRSISIHIGSLTPRWISRDLLWLCFHYPYVQLGCEYIFGQVPAHNSKALAFDLKIGFKEIARIEGVFPEGDLVVVRMHRDECRYLMPRKRG
jgi:RimJ/RimL family protein N-acetyltransferase